MNPLDWGHGFQLVLFGCAPGWHGAGQIQAFQHANRDEARQSSMNHRCSSVALLGMSSRKSLAPTSRPKERQSPCSGTLSPSRSSLYGFAASKKPVFIKGSSGFVGGCSRGWPLFYCLPGDLMVASPMGSQSLVGSGSGWSRRVILYCLAANRPPTSTGVIMR